MSKTTHHSWRPDWALLTNLFPTPGVYRKQPASTNDQIANLTSPSRWTCRPGGACQAGRARRTPYRGSFPILLIASLLITPLAQAQIGDLYNKAKQKAKSALDKTINGTTGSPGTSAATASPSGTGTAAGSPDTTAATTSTPPPNSATSTNQGVASPDAQFTHCFQTGETFSRKVYISDLFATTDVVTISSPDLSTQRQKLFHDNMPAFHKFLTSTYGEIFGWVTHGSASCEDPAPRSRAELKRAAEIERFRNNPNFKDGIVETHWVNGPRPADTSSFHDNDGGPSSSGDNSGASRTSDQTQTAGSDTTFMHCSIRVPSSRKIYISDIFGADSIHMQAPGEPGISNRRNLAMFVQFIASKYGESSDPRQGRFQESCSSPLPLAQAQLQREEEKDRYRLNDLYRDGIVDAPWTNGPHPSVNSERASNAGPAPGPRQPATATDGKTILDALVEREHRMAPRYCEGNESLHHTYDCTCFADKILESRKQNVSIAHAAGYEPVLHPQLGQLASTVDLRSCVDPDKTKAYINRTVEHSFTFKPAQWRATLAACTSDKFVAQMQSDPLAMAHWSIDQTNDLTACRMNNNLK